MDGTELIRLVGLATRVKARTRDLEVLELCDAVLRDLAWAVALGRVGTRPVTSTECEGCRRRREADSARQRRWRRKASG
jgi:hypothetical protein